MKFADVDFDQLNDSTKTVYSYAKDDAPTKSGSLDHTRIKATTWPAAYVSYSKFVEARGEAKLGPTRFYQIMTSWDIRPQKYDEYACPHCFAWDMGERTHEAHAHMDHVKIAAEKYRELIQALPEDGAQLTDPQKYIIVLIDYCRIHELGYVGKEKKKVSVFNITVVLDANHQVSYDYLSPAKQSYEFMASSLIHFFNHHLETLSLPKEVELTFWSDGGLRNYGTVDILHSLAIQSARTISIMFFPSYHGHSRCDAHFGYLKMSLRRTYPNGGLNSVDQVLQKLSEMKNTHSTLLDSATLGSELEQGTLGGWKSKKGDKQGVKSYSTFLFSPDGAIQAMRVIGTDKDIWYKKTPLQRVLKAKTTGGSNIASASPLPNDASTQDMPSSTNAAIASSAQTAQSAPPKAAKKSGAARKQTAPFPSGKGFYAALAKRISDNPEAYRASYIRSTGKLPSIEFLQQDEAKET